MEFTEFYQEIISTVNLPFTILMGLVLLYWLLVIVGVLGMEAFDFDLDIDADMDLDAGLEAGPGGAFGEALAFMHLGEVPIMIVGSILIFFMWICSVLSNYYVNTEHNVLFSFLFLIPNIGISLLMTKAIIWPFMLGNRDQEELVKTREDMIGVRGVVKTSEITESFGQVEIENDGPAIVINARSRKGERLVKGDCAKIEAYNSANDTFTVSLSKWENK